MGTVPGGGNSLSIVGWIEWKLTKYWNLTETQGQSEIPNRIKHSP